MPEMLCQLTGLRSLGRGVRRIRRRSTGKPLLFGEVYQDVEVAGDAFAVAGQVAGPGLLDAAAPGGIVAQAYEGGVARVALVELQGGVVGLALWRGVS